MQLSIDVLLLKKKISKVKIFRLLRPLTKNKIIYNFGWCQNDRSENGFLRRLVRMRTDLMPDIGRWVMTSSIQRKTICFYSFAFALSLEESSNDWFTISEKVQRFLFQVWCILPHKVFKNYCEINEIELKKSFITYCFHLGAEKNRKILKTKGKQNEMCRWHKKCAI